MSTWIRLDPQELGATGVHLRDVSLSLEASARRIDAACCSPGLGRHSAPLMAECRDLAARVVATTQDYLRQAIDILQRAIVAVQDQQLVSVVGGTGSVAAGIIGASVVGGTGPGWSGGGAGPVTVTIGGTSWTNGLSITPGAAVSTIGGSGYGFVGGGSALSAVSAIGAMIQTKQQSILDRLNVLSAAGVGRGGAGADLANQSLINSLNRQAMSNIYDNEVKMAASSPFATRAAMQQADNLDSGGRVRADERRHGS